MAKFCSVSLQFHQCYKLGVPSSKFSCSDRTEHLHCTCLLHAQARMGKKGMAGAWYTVCAGKKLLLALLISRNVTSFRIRGTLKMQNADMNPKHTWRFYFCLFLILTLNKYINSKFEGTKPRTGMSTGISDVLPEVREHNTGLSCTHMSWFLQQGCA